VAGKSSRFFKYKEVVMERKDLLYNFRDKIEKKRRRKNIIIILIVILFLFIGFNIWNNRKIDLVSYQVENLRIPKTFNEYRILQLSDIFGKNFGNKNKVLLEEIDLRQPDIVVLSGNIIDREGDYKAYLLNLKENIKKPIYYVFGDEEFSLADKDQKELIKFLDDNNIYLINSKKVSLMSGGENIYLYGSNQDLRDYAYNFKDDKSKSSITNSGLKNDSKDFNIMISHNPDYVNVYSKENYNLMLGGLKTGGIARLPLVGGLIKPKNASNLAYDGGKYWVDDTLLIVSKGLSTNRFKRIFNRPELVEINLYGKTEVDNGKK